MKNILVLSLLTFTILTVISGCSKSPEMTLEEVEAYRASSQSDLMKKAISRSWKDEEWKTGIPGGEWNDTISGDPKSFNLLIAERDGETSGILSPLTTYFADYNTVKKEWVPHCASFQVKVDQEKQTLDVIYTLRDDLYWSYYNDSKPKVQITSDDPVFWYNEILCDKEMGSSSYNSQFMEMPDGSEELITCEKIDRFSFVFHFPRIVSEPILHTNMNFGPAFIYGKAKEEGGAAGVKDILTVETDPRTIPSSGEYFITEYIPGQRIVYQRNPDYWEKDDMGQSIAYPEKRIYRIVSDPNTKFLLFKEGKVEDYSPSPEQLDETIANARNNQKEGYSVFSSAGSLSAPFWTFNQNPQNKESPWYYWFCKKEFRQAMSCLLNRDRIIRQTYRGLAEPKYTFFPEGNAFYNEEILLEYRFSHKYAAKLLAGAGFKLGKDGFLYDDRGIKVEFDLSIIGSSPVYSDMALIIADECKKEGISVNIRQTDFQKLVEQMTATYDWQSLLIGFSGSGIFPSQGSNVWSSDGNMHLWYPLQEEPATPWEARIDQLYNQACCTVDHDQAQPLWDEYQRIILEQCPIIYLVRSRSFYAINNRWDLSNVYYDNLNGAMVSHVFLRSE